MNKQQNIISIYCPKIVTPAKAGVHLLESGFPFNILDSRLRGNDKKRFSQQELIAAFMIMVLSVSMTVFAGQSEIRLRRKAAIPAGSVCLADVADIKADSTELQNQLNNLVVAQVSGDIKNFSVGYLEIARALNQAHISPSGVDIYGASYCRLTPQELGEKEKNVAAQVISNVSANVAPTVNDDKVFSSTGDNPVTDSEVFTLADQLTRLVAQMSGLDEAKLKIEWRCGDPEFLGQAADKERFKVKPRSTVTLGEVRFEVADIQAGPEAQQRNQTMVRVRGTVQLICESVVATRVLAPGDVITEKDVKLMTRRVSSYLDLGLTDINEVLGQEVARPITPDTVIKPALIRKLMLVKRNQKINVHSRVGSVQIDVQGTALESGAYGDVIRVRFDNQNRTIIRGHIAGPGMVMVTGAEPEGSVKMVKAAAKPKRGDFPLTPREQK